MAQIKVKVGDLVRFYRPDPGVFPSLHSQVIGVVTGASRNFVNVEINGIRYLSKKSCLAHVKLNKWIPWKGGNCPLPAVIPYQVHLRNGWKSHTGIAPETLRWYHIGNGGDIVEFRIMEGK